MTANIYTLATPLPDAIAHFERKHGVTPNVVRVRPGSEMEADGVKVIEDSKVLTKEYWVGREHDS